MIVAGPVANTNAAGYTAALRSDLAAALAGVPSAFYYAYWSDPLGLSVKSGKVIPIAEAAAFDRVASHAHLLAWAWPTAPAPGAPIPAALPVSAAALWHLSDAWSRRGEPNVLLIRYQDLSADLEGQMRWLAERLGIAVPEQAWPALIQAATFESMRDSADTLVPTAGIFKSNAAFFRRGTSGAGRDVLGDEELAAYYARVTQLAPSDMLTWLHSSHEGR